MAEVICKEVVITTLERRGQGVKHSPIRCITQVYEKDGTLIAEYDPMPETFAVMDLVHFAKWCIEKKYIGVETADVHKWLDSIESQNK